MGAIRRGEEGLAGDRAESVLQGEPGVPGAREPDGAVRAARTELPGNALAAAAARSFVRAALRDWGLRGMLVDDAVLLVSELVTNAVVHAGTSVDVECRQVNGTVLAEVSDRNPVRTVLARGDEGRGYGLRLIAALAKEWGISYRRDRKTVWFRMGPAEQEGAGPHPDDGLATVHWQRHAPEHGAFAPGEHRGTRLTRPGSGSGPGSGPGPEWTSHGALSFLAEASDLLAGHTDEDKVASLAGQLMVPRFADWCAVWLEDPDTVSAPRLARVWHAQEDRIEEVRAALHKDPPVPAPRSLPGQALPWRWPGDAASTAPGGASVACRLVVGGRNVGTLLIGRAGLLRIPDEVMGLVEDFARRVALAVLSARRYTRQANISQILQRGLLPSGEAAIPGIDTAVVYEPSGEGAWAGGDFYDFLELPDGRWRFALGDVQGNGPEAAVVTGLARPVLRLLAREGFTVTETLDRLNREIGEQARFLSLLYGEIAFRTEDEGDGEGDGAGGGADCSVVCAGHPLPLVRDRSGGVRAAALPQLLLGVMPDVRYDSQCFSLRPGDTLLCVTDGVTERRSGRRLFDDGDGLARVLGGCAGLDAAGTAERVRRAVHDFAPGAPTDDLALLVLKAPEA